MKLTLELSANEIEEIILNHSRHENGLKREEVTLIWDEHHNLTIVQDTDSKGTPRTSREWLNMAEADDDVIDTDTNTDTGDDNDTN